MYAVIMMKTGDVLALNEGDACRVTRTIIIQLLAVRKNVMG